MSQIVTSKNLNEVIKKNFEIDKQIQSKVNVVLSRYNSSKVNSLEKLGFNILKRNLLIQIPIPDKYFGGLIAVKGELKIPIINTAQPRVYQYFIAWHEIYHLLFDEELEERIHKINFDMELNERCADYFAAKILLGDVYNFFFSLDDKNFIDKIFRCMDVYKVPYKAILIQLYQDSITFKNDSLIKCILENFDNNLENIIERFEKLGLDIELLKPTYIYDVLALEDKIKRAIEDNPDVDIHKSNLKYFQKISKFVFESKENFINESR